LYYMRKTNMQKMIPVSRPILGPNAKKYVNECIKTTWLSSNGPYVKKFEDQFAEYLGVKYAVAVTSGTNAMHCALAAVGVGPDDEIIVADFTYVASLYTPMYLGATPVLVDAKRDSWNMDEDQIEAKISKKTKAIMVAHMYGQPVNMTKVMEVAKKHNLKVVEDAAAALGAEWNGKKAGSMGDVGCFSLYANKTITTGEGGMAVTNNSKYAENLQRLRNMGEKPGRRFYHERLGYTYRMSNLQAAVGLAQIENVQKLMKRKREIGKLYDQLLGKTEKLQLPAHIPQAKNIFWMYGVLSQKREEVRKFLLRNGIETREFHLPLHCQPVIKEAGLFKNEKYPAADYLSKYGFYLPSGPDISDKEIRYVCQKLKEAAG
jgi:perosamine synthetase